MNETDDNERKKEKMIIKKTIVKTNKKICKTHILKNYADCLEQRQRRWRQYHYQMTDFDSLTLHIHICLKCLSFYLFIVLLFFCKIVKTQNLTNDYVL